MIAFALTAEELHYLAAAFELDAVPGLGPLPLDPDDPAALRFMLGTAERSLNGRGIGPDVVAPLLEPLLAAKWTVTAELAGPEELGARAWWGDGTGVTVELAQLSDTDYGLTVVEDARERLAEFLGLGGDDASVDAPELKEGLSLFNFEGATLVRATRVVRAGEGAEGVALEWLDRGDGPVWVVEDDVATPTGRAAVLDALFR